MFFRERSISCFIFFLLAISLFIFSCKKDPAPPDDGGVIIDTGGLNTIIPETKDIVMYEIHPWAFSSTKDLPGITSRLDSVKALGINAIWIMPIYPIGSLNSFGSPYCIKNYEEVNPDLGTMNDLKTLVTEAHNRKIAVMLDWVANHTSWDAEWIVHKSWYTQNASGNIISPPGTTWNDVADLNYSNDTMRLAMIEAMKFWITNADIDGFRCDAADYVPFDFWKQAIDSLHRATDKNLILLAEGSRADHFTAGFQMNFSWDFLSTIKNVFKNNYGVNNLFATDATEYSQVPDGSRKLRFTTNHDESNISTPPSVYINKEGATAASVIAIFMHGVPLIYSGQEVGVSSTSTYNGGTINWSQNPEMLSAYKKLLNFYASSDAAKSVNLTAYSGSDIAAFSKELDGKEILVLVNTRNAVKSFTLPAALANTTWTNIMDQSTFVVPATIEMQPYQYLVLNK